MLLVHTGFGRSHTGYLPSIALFRAWGVNLRRRTRRVPRRPGARDFYAFGNFELLDGRFCGYPLY